MGGKDAVLPESLLKNHTVIFLTYEQNTKKPYKDNLCLFRALALHLHGKERLEEEIKKYRSYSISFLLIEQILTLQNFKEFAWMIFHQWKL